MVGRKSNPRINTMTAAHSTDPIPYGVHTSEDLIVAEALRILTLRTRQGDMLDSPQKVRELLTLRHAGLEREQFDVLYLDSQHRMIELATEFTGTVSQTSVYPREIVRRSLQLNASAVILAHNHPSGDPKPSRADEFLTQTLKSALALVDVRVLDHIITGGGQARSMAELGLV
jgi:DNA repair protein RadC